MFPKPSKVRSVSYDPRCINCLRWYHITAVIRMILSMWSSTICLTCLTITSRIWGTFFRDPPSSQSSHGDTFRQSSVCVYISSSHLALTFRLVLGGLTSIDICGIMCTAAIYRWIYIYIYIYMHHTFHLDFLSQTLQLFLKNIHLCKLKINAAAFVQQTFQMLILQTNICTYQWQWAH